MSLRSIKRKEKEKNLQITNRRNGTHVLMKSNVHFYKIFEIQLMISSQANHEVFSRGTWVAHLVEHPPLGFSSVHDLRVVGSSPTSVFALCLCFPPCTSAPPYSKLT